MWRALWPSFICSWNLNLVDGIIHERGPMIVLKMCCSLVISWTSRITSFRTLKYKHDLLFLLYQINLLQVKFNAKVTDQLIMKWDKEVAVPAHYISSDVWKLFRKGNNMVMSALTEALLSSKGSCTLWRLVVISGPAVKDCSWQRHWQRLSALWL